ncbi:MAG: hypothetical protein IJ706_02010 [Clostridia bacterium]|nr:hypothetical protein [Clostridia bacterium]
MKKFLTIFMVGVMAVISALTLVGCDDPDEIGKESYNEYEEITGEYLDDSVLVTLKTEYSIYRGINENIVDKLLKLNVESIENLTEYPESYIDESGMLDKDKAPKLYSHFQEVDFHQILLLELKEPGKEQVKELIYRVKQFEEVMFVEPNRIDKVEQTE